jgi:2-oxoglutarate ferredoxin oxidoreductase subunit delta
MVVISHIEIDAELCKGCGLCIDPCVQKAVRIGEKTNSKGYRYAEQVIGSGEDDECTACESCAVMCPDSAITVYKVEA